VTTVAELDALPAREAAELLRSCCGATRWVSGMLARRPFATEPALLSAADEVWRSLGDADWREAFAHHPRIGESRSAAAQSQRARDWSSGEQSGMNAAADSVRTALAEANAAYDARFGYVCIICAAGRSAEEMLALTRSRLSNAPDAELRIAAEEQRKITRLRLEKLFHDDTGALRR
jgi:2-oxo-4-hydroxy-4-carboxy-5-ureidoimidazoline decarboxylase